MNYTLPSGLAGCTNGGHNEPTGWRIPSAASDRNKALKEALQELCRLQAEHYDLVAQVEQLKHTILSAAEYWNRDTNHDAMLDALENLDEQAFIVRDLIPPQSLVEIQAQAIESVLDYCPAWSVMNTYAITVEDIAEYADKIRSEVAE